MPKPSKPQKFYAVKKGRETGVFLTWEECRTKISQFPGAEYKSFGKAVDAAAFVSGTLTTSPSKNSNLGDKTQGRGHKRSMSEVNLEESEYDVVYCDGACKGNGRSDAIAGIGVWWGENDSRNFSERCPGDQTNNRAELIAVIRMLETTPISSKPLLIKTDSKYTINCVERWIKKWAANGYRTALGDPVKNPAVVRYLSSLLKIRREHHQEVAFQYVKGHSGNRGNDGADALATLGTLLPPLPERDWAAIEQRVHEEAEEERRRNPGLLSTAPAQVVNNEAERTPPKKRRISDEAQSRKNSPSTPVTRLSLLSRSFHGLSRSPSSTRSSTEVAEVSPLPVQSKTSTPGRRISNALPEVGPLPRSPISTRSPSAELKARKHGAGFFKDSPAQMKNQRITASDFKALSPLPGLQKQLQSIPDIYSPLSKLSNELQVSASPHKVMSMSVREEDINLEDYADCLSDGDSLLTC